VAVRADRDPRIVPLPIFVTEPAIGYGLGAAGTRGEVDQYEDESGVVGGGVGGRYLYRPQDDLWVGLDLAQGPGDTVLYVQVGHAW
jgi:hypothetical protein